MECQQVRDEIVKFTDNELSDETRKAIQKHLDNCIECSKELEFILGIAKLCQYWKDISPSRDWKLKLRQKLKQVNREPMAELEILRNAVISLNRRIQELEESYLPPILESDVMTVEDLARYLRLSIDQVYDMIDQLPRFQIGYEYRFRKESIDQWIRSLEAGSHSQEYFRVD